MNPSAPKIRSVVSALLHKELWQLFPLLPMLAVVFGGGIVLFLSLEQIARMPRGNSWDLLYHLVGLVFTIGAVALSVSQEKETRSLSWLRTLPLKPTTILACKWWAGLVGVSGVWAFSLVLAWVLHNGLPVELRLDQWLLALTVNAYLLTAGLAIVWRLDSLFVALLWMLVIAFLPAVLTQVVYQGLATRLWPSLDQRYSELTTLWLQFCTCGMLTWIAGVLMVRWGTRSLTATKTAVIPTDRTWQPYCVSRPTILNDSVLSPLAALNWQFIRQNRWGLSVVGGLYILSVAVGALAVNLLGIGLEDLGERRHPAIFVAGLTGLLATSWLGVLSLGGDAVRRQIRFLADRGVSREQVWWTRQSVPLAMLTSYDLGVLVVLDRSGWFPAGWWLDASGMLVMVVAATLLVFALSQWVGQQLPSLLLASVVAPPVALSGTLLAGWLLLEAHIGLTWLWLGVALVLFGVWRLMPAWMDQHLRRRDSGRQVAVAIGLGLGLLAYAFQPLILPPRLPAQVAAEIEAFRHRTGLTRFNSNALRSSPWSQTGSAAAAALDADPPAESPPRSFRAELERELARIEDRLAMHAFPLRTQDFLSDGVFLEQFADLIPHWDEAEAERERLFTQVISAYFELVRRVRRSPRLDDQAAADLGEIHLVRLLLQPDRARWLTDERHDAIVEYLANQEARQLARRQAIVVGQQIVEDRSLWDWLQLGAVDVSGISLDGPPSRSWSDQLHRHTRALRMLELLWKLSSDPTADHSQTLEDLALNLSQPIEYYGGGPLGHYFRIDDALGVLPDRSSVLFGIPVGQQWSAGWERQARQLNRRGAGFTSASEGERP